MVLRLDPSRGRAMGDRVVRTARSFGVEGPGLDLLYAAHDLALARREERVPDDHAPPYLHPGRTALILMEEGPLHDPLHVAASMMVDTLRPDLQPEPRDVRGRLGEDVGGIAEAVPRPEGEAAALLEELLAVDPGVALVALSEHLDQIRHAHIGTEPWERRRIFGYTTTVYAPLADRLSQGLARRFDYICRTFSRRFLSGDRPPG